MMSSAAVLVGLDIRWMGEVCAGSVHEVVHAHVAAALGPGPVLYVPAEEEDQAAAGSAALTVLI
jgi:hypothetical protein